MKKYLLLLPILLLFYPIARPTQPVIYEIPPHTSFLKIQHDLYKLGFQPFYGAMLIKMFISHDYKKIQAGEYLLIPGMSLAEIIDMLLKGRKIIHRITIPEGLEMVHVIEKINNTPYLTGTINTMPEEGSLFPTTLFYTKGMDRQKVVAKFQQIMDKKLHEIWSNRSSTCLLKSPHELLTLASIIERETNVDAEKERVAGVFMNRLRKNMRLQSCPTVMYALKVSKLSKDDLKHESCYNTYVHGGLPPTPICCPGENALKAAANPAETKELYFVVTGEGGHHFAENYQTHQKNIRLWKKNR